MDGIPVCSICDRPVQHASQPFVVDGLGRDAHLICYERLGRFPTPLSDDTPTATPDEIDDLLADFDAL